MSMASGEIQLPVLLPNVTVIGFIVDTAWGEEDSREDPPPSLTTIQDCNTIQMEPFSYTISRDQAKLTSFFLVGFDFWGHRDVWGVARI